ncbi:MAG: serine protease [Actinomycetota bacterium]
MAVRRRTAVSATLLGLIAIAAAVAFAVVWGSVPERSAEERAVTIASLPCDNPRQSTSSGFVIDDRTIVTVAHAIYGSRDFAIQDADGVWYRPEIVRLDLEDDLAVLRVPEVRAGPMDVVPRRDVAAWPGTAVVLAEPAASGTSLDATVLRRVKLSVAVVGDRDRVTERFGYELAVDILPGDSGAAVVDDTDGLVAVVFAQSTSREAIAWAIAADEIDLTSAPIPDWDCNPVGSKELELEAPESLATADS